MREPVVRVLPRTLTLPVDHVDTDQNIPPRFITATGREGLDEGPSGDGQCAMRGTRRPVVPLHRDRARGARILVAGENFGCGSSREHAAWALHANGFRVVIAASVADIFRGNALRNGIAPVELEQEALEALAAHPDAEVTVDVEAETVTLPGGGTAHFRLPRFGRRCLITGLGPLDFLLANLPRIEEHEARLARE